MHIYSGKFVKLCYLVPLTFSSLQYFYATFVLSDIRGRSININ